MEDIFTLSDWAKYTDHKALDDLDLPGIYCLAHFEKPPTTAPSVTAKEIIYIGETTEQNIARRLYQFGRTAFKRYPAHSGGSRYSDTYLMSIPVDRPPENLYVAIMAFRSSNPEETKVYIKYLERAAIWSYFQTNHAIPSCNAC
ncbi:MULTISPECIES: hypothetical protein [Pandoraea]|uniref:hypothetical protein n=1 Tax=Pandoraea TaxID=93217 RepID=UPI001F5E14D9|nr:MULTISPECIES: hypothetical protein [Pandoraea]MCI3206394.1 hypothetical protein [Pandoraea sp. LA3]MDN4584422.1 hypothetical protein [Pandoraea capi]